MVVVVESSYIQQAGMQGMQWAHATSYHSWWWCEYEATYIVSIANTLVVACASYCGYSTEGRNWVSLVLH